LLGLLALQAGAIAGRNSAFYPAAPSVVVPILDDAPLCAARCLPLLTCTPRW